MLRRRITYIGITHPDRSHSFVSETLNESVNVICVSDGHDAGIC